MTAPSSTRPEDVGVLLGELVAALAVGLTRMTCSHPLAAEHVLLERDGLEMVRVAATPNPAEVIDDQTLWDRSGEQFVGDTMY